MQRNMMAVKAGSLHSHLLLCCLIALCVHICYLINNWFNHHYTLLGCELRGKALSLILCFLEAELTTFKQEYGTLSWLGEQGHLSMQVQCAKAYTY